MRAMTPDFPVLRALGAFIRVASLAAFLAGCAAPPAPLSNGVSTPLAEDALRAVEAAPGGALYAVDAGQSQVRIFVFRAGRAPALGHNHVLTVPQLEGRLWTPEQGLAGAEFALGFRLDQMLLDPPDVRTEAGAGWASVLSPEAIAATREHMLGPDNLQADNFPWVRLRSLQIAGEAPHLAAELEIELHGQKRTHWVALEARPAGEGWTVRGGLVLRQSDYGVRPYSVLGGLLAVQDELVIDFRLSLHKAAR